VTAAALYVTETTWSIVAQRPIIRSAGADNERLWDVTGWQPGVAGVDAFPSGRITKHSRSMLLDPYPQRLLVFSPA
jgi:hypothetical protein